MSNVPETCFANVGADRVAYQVMGEGPRDIVMTSGQVGNVDLDWEEPEVARFLRRIASFGRLIRFDARGAGLSDPRPADGRKPDEYWAQDLLAVLNAVGSTSSAIFGFNDAGVLALPFAANYPARVSALVLFNTTARYTVAPDYPEGHPREVVEQFVEYARKYWGTDRFSAGIHPALASDPRALRQRSKAYRAMASPKEQGDYMATHADLDARSALPLIRAPTLVMMRKHYRLLPLAQAKYIADHIPGGRFIELPGSEFTPYWETPDVVLDHIEEFLTGVRRSGEPGKALVAVLFTDIVDSTRRAAELGDKAWRELLDRHDEVQREQVGLYKGRIVDSAGDGMFATFERPDRAIECAQALHKALGDAGIPIRAGVHFGDVELRDDGRVGGMTIHIGARVLAQAAAGEVLVSRTVRDVLIGSRYAFGDRGTHTLKGVPGEWPLFAIQ